MKWLHVIPQKYLLKMSKKGKYDTKLNLILLYAEMVKIYNTIINYKPRPVRNFSRINNDNFVWFFSMNNVKTDSISFEKQASK